MQWSWIHQVQLVILLKGLRPYCRNGNTKFVSISFISQLFYGRPPTSSVPCFVASAHSVSRKNAIQAHIIKYPPKIFPSGIDARSARMGQRKRSAAETVNPTAYGPPIIDSSACKTGLRATRPDLIVASSSAPSSICRRRGLTTPASTAGKRCVAAKELSSWIRSGVPFVESNNFGSG